MYTLIEILSPDFVLRDALYTSLLMGLVCPVVGTYLVLRRMVFLGVALPQISASGIAFAFLLWSWLNHDHQHGLSSEHNLALSGSLIFTLLGLSVLALLESRRRYSAESKIGVAYSLCSAFTILFLAADPRGEAEMVNILKGDMLAATHERFVFLAIFYFLILSFLILFRRQLLLISFDRELAQVFRMALKRWEIALYLCIGVCVAVGVMSAGPLVVFGFLILPCLIARLLSGRMSRIVWLSSLVGFVLAFVGFYFSYVFDLPLGATQVGLMSLVLVSIAGAKVALAWLPTNLK